MSNSRRWCFVLTALFLPLIPAIGQGQEPLDEALEQATKQAVARVAPCLVQIQTVGGLDVLGGGRGPQIIRGQGPTTGVIASPDGFILSSSFNFAHKPSGITVSLPGGKPPLAAKVVATDHTRMLTLLKVEATGLPVPEAAPKKDFKIGQWAIALGKTWSATADGPPSVSLGVISALNRVWNKAVQTDAKVSPVNYGGPLIDVQGRVIGVLVPLHPFVEGELAGVEWYDSGIGFAVPLEDINRVLPKLKAGSDLRRGYLGISPQSQDVYSVPPVVASTLFESAAAKAGIQPGDQITELDGHAISRYAQVQHILGAKYEGDRVSVKVKRKKEDKEEVLDFPNLELTGPPTSHLHAFLGVLPVRDDPENAVEVRHVYPKSPADQAGIKPGDRITKVEGKPFAGRDHLQQLLNGVTPGVAMKIEVQRKLGDQGNKTETVSVKLAGLPNAIPEELPVGTKKLALAPRKPLPGQMPFKPGLPGKPGKPRPEKPGDKPEEKPAAEKPKEKKPARTGHYTNKDPLTGREHWVYVPEDYDPNISYALVVWLHPAGDSMEDTMLRIWGELCAKHHLILFGPKAQGPVWLTSEADEVRREIRELLGQYTIDRQRIVLHGMGQGGNLAFFLALDARDLVRGVATIGGMLQSQIKENVAGQRLSFYIAGGAKDPIIEGIRATHKRLTEKRFPVIEHEIPDQGSGYYTDAERIRELARWIDSLDRL